MIFHKGISSLLKVIHKHTNAQKSFERASSGPDPVSILMSMPCSIGLGQRELYKCLNTYMCVFICASIDGDVYKYVCV